MLIAKTMQYGGHYLLLFLLFVSFVVVVDDGHHVTAVASCVASDTFIVVEVYYVDAVVEIGFVAVASFIFYVVASFADFFCF